jgi:hypothetical protein
MATISYNGDPNDLTDEEKIGVVTRETHPYVTVDCNFENAAHDEEWQIELRADPTLALEGTADDGPFVEMVLHSRAGMSRWEIEPAPLNEAECERFIEALRSTLAQARADALARGWSSPDLAPDKAEDQTGG